MGYGPGVSTILTLDNQTSSYLVLWNSEDSDDNVRVENGQSHTQPGTYGTTIPIWNDDDVTSSFNQHNILIGTNVGLALIWQHQYGSIYYKINSFPTSSTDGNTWPGNGANIKLTASDDGGTLSLSASS